MQIDDKLLDHIAALARLRFEDAERGPIKNDMSRILDFIEQMNGVNTDNVEPLVYLSEARNVLRKDEVVQSLGQADALRNAPDKDSDYFKVPKVLRKDQ